MKVIVWLAVIALVLFLLIGCEVWLGVGGWGPKVDRDVTILHTYVDHGEEDSHYMVGTDAGSFEVANGIMLGVWNADDIFGSIKEGHRYRITTSGNRYANIVLQEYPYITRAIELK